jgi:ATPase subunit of ABC transporter with duplicated ATPase domains
MFMSFLEEALKKLEEYYANHPYGRFLPHKPVDKKAEKETEKTTKAKTKEEKKAEKEAKKAAKKAEKEAKKAAKKAEKEAKKAAKKAAKEAKKAAKTENTAETTVTAPTVEGTTAETPTNTDRTQLKADLTQQVQAAYPTNAQITSAVNGSYLNLSDSQSYLENGTITNIIPTPTIDKSALTLDLTSQTITAYPTDDKVTAQVQEADTVALSSSKTYLDSNGTSGKDLATNTLTKTVQKPTELSPALMTYLNQQRA